MRGPGTQFLGKKRRIFRRGAKNRLIGCAQRITTGPVDEKSAPNRPCAATARRPRRAFQTTAALHKNSCGSGLWPRSRVADHNGLWFGAESASVGSSFRERSRLSRVLSGEVCPRKGANERERGRGKRSERGETGGGEEETICVARREVRRGAWRPGVLHRPRPAADLRACHPGSRMKKSL